MSWTDQDHQKALQKVRDGTAGDWETFKIKEAARQAGSRGEEAKQALKGK